MNLLIAPGIYLLTGFAHGRYTRHKFALKMEKVRTGKNCIGGVSFQLHTRKGVRYVDLVVWRWRPWLARIRMRPHK